MLLVWGIDVRIMALMQDKVSTKTFIYQSYLGHSTVIRNIDRNSHSWCPYAKWWKDSIYPEERYIFIIKKGNATIKCTRDCLQEIYGSKNVVLFESFIFLLQHLLLITLAELH